MRDRESSVVTSLGALFQMEEERRQNEREAKVRAREEAEARAMAEAEARAAARERESRERAQAEAVRVAVEEAQIEGAKVAQIEKSRLEVQIRLQAEALARHEAHARELAAMIDARRTADPPRRWPVALAIFGTAVVVLVASLSLRKEPPPPPAPVPIATAPRDDSAERAIARLEKEIAALRAETANVAPAQTASASTKPTVVAPAPKPKPTGTKCPPGVHGIPLCP